MIHCEIELCVGCKMCEIACATEHFGAVSPALSRIRVAKQDETGIDFAISCLSCQEKPCLECPTEALSVKDTGEILLDQEVCLGCLECVETCPIGAVGFYDQLPLFCDLCGGKTSCVTACPTDALTYREDYRDVSLEAFIDDDRRESIRRMNYALEIAKPLREQWKSGRRVDS